MRGFEDIDARKLNQVMLQLEEKVEDSGVKSVDSEMIMATREDIRTTLVPT